MQELQKYNKAIVAVVGAVVAGLSMYYGSNNTTVQMVIALATALGVYAVPNK